MNGGGDEAETGCKHQLTRISEALGLPVSAFFGDDPGTLMATGMGDQAEAYLLKLIAAYLREATPETRNRFVRSVEAMLNTGFR